MRVFILCTGRSGSTTIIKAAKHINNYTSSHESLASRFGDERFSYPSNHIEADNRLSWNLGHLNRIFGNDAFYVHLKRNRDKVARSFHNRFLIPGSIIDAFSEGIRMNQPEKLSEEEMLTACYDYVDTVNANIEYFISDKPNAMTINIENIDKDFTDFWHRISAEGDLKEAIKEFKTTHNASVKRKINFGARFRRIVRIEWKHLMMSLKSKYQS